MSIYKNSRTPYFYIIRHKDTNKRYAGAKWAKDANPDTFMQNIGYCTSSGTVKRLIKATTEVIFSVEEMIELNEINCIPFGCQTVQEYETWFLLENECSIDTGWYNGHNNLTAFHDLIKTDKAIENHRIAVGSEECKTKRVETTRELYGVDNVWQSEDVKKKIRETNMIRHGAEHALQSEEIRNRTFDTKKDSYGWSQPYQDKTIIEKAQATMVERYGVAHGMQSDEIRNKGKSTMLALYGEDNPAKFPWRCITCNKNGRGTGNITRWHKECEVEMLTKPQIVDNAQSIL